MMGDKKKMAAAIVAKLNPAKESPEPESDEPKEGEGLAASASDILSALESRDAAGLSAALRSFIEQCE